MSSVGLDQIEFRNWNCRYRSQVQNICHNFEQRNLIDGSFSWQRRIMDLS